MHTEAKGENLRISGEVNFTRWCAEWADGVPAYVIVWDNDQKKREKVIHCACLLLWFANNDSNADGIRLDYLNVTSSRSSVTNAENMNPMSGAHSEGVMGTVSHELDYGMDLANFILGKPFSGFTSCWL